MSILYDFEFEEFPKQFMDYKFDTFASLHISYKEDSPFTFKRKKDSKKYNYFFDEFNHMYNQAYKYKKIKKLIKFKKKDFCYNRFDYGKMAGDETNANYYILYITLPSPHEADFPRVWCTGYAIPFRSFPSKQVEIFNLYTIEKSIDGTTCIGAVGENGEHYNYGPAGNYEKWNATQVLNIEFGQDTNFFRF